MKVTIPNKKKQKFFKKRTFSFKKLICWQIGDAAGFLKRALFITSKQLFRFILMLKWLTSKRERTHRGFWFKTTSLIPVTKKAQNSRMGKGRGKFKSWGSRISAMVLLYEVWGVRYGRLLFYTKQIRARFIPTLCAIKRL